MFLMGRTRPVLSIIMPVARPDTKEANAAAKPAPTGSKGGLRSIRSWTSFFSSGVFFMLFGTLMLFFAYRTLGSVHSSFSFILVVVGVSILLYGTGTQGLGELDSQSELARYKVRIAGGAGVLTFCIAFGIVWKSDEIKNAFQIEKRYFAMSIVPEAASGITDYFDDYVLETIVDGESAPVFRRDTEFVTFVPYFLGQESFDVRLRFVYASQKQRNALLAPEKEVRVSVALSDASGNSLLKELGGYDFPIYEEKTTVKLVSEADPEDIAERADEGGPDGINEDKPPQLEFVAE